MRLLAILVLAVPAVLGAQGPHRDILRQKLERDIRAIAERFDGVMAVQVVDLTDGTAVGVNADLVFPQGSAIKIPILVELYRRAGERPGLLRERRPITRAVQTGGSGILQWFGDGSSELALEDLAVLMIVLSDNSATNVLIEELGMDAVNRTMRALGLPRTRLQRMMIRPEASARGEENVSTASEAAQLMARIHRCELPVPAESCASIRRILELPKEHPVRRPVPPDVAIAFKPGGVEGIGTVWALVALPDRPYVLAVMTNYGKSSEDAMERTASVAYEYFSRLSRSTSHGVRVPQAVLRERRP